MPQLRKDPVLGRWVIIAAERAKRPSDFKVEPQQAQEGVCPFCEGNEFMTPPEIVAFRDEGTEVDHPGWRVRVVPNKFPALRIEGRLDKRGLGIYDQMQGIGAHEVVIETPVHVRSLTDLTADGTRDVIYAYRDRLVDLRKDPRMVCGMVFKNVGTAAGASLDHTHSQLIVTPVVPRTVQQEMDGCRKFHEYRGRCLFCDMVEQEEADRARVVAESPKFLAFAPYAPRFPFETWIVPRRHSSHFEDIQDDEVPDMARMLQLVIGKMERLLDRPAYNYMIHSSPLPMERIEQYHWHVEVIPRLTSVAGFEWGSGFYINSVPPEAAAEFLRDA
jgi:UDPglucose--hexose-1-phosphate uridylyltransferase